jgi:exopolyphosphatase / guanosine-5'-triphosphate,3'-diphosphate pyrophosphatase
VRVGVVDIGTNSTRLLIADVDGGDVDELDRRTRVTRLGQGVDASGALADEAIERVLAALDEYVDAIREAGCDATTAVLTSAVRDAANGGEFTAIVRRRYGLDARTISGDEEAALTYRGATSERDPSDARPLVLIDIGGGSTEFVVGAHGEVSFHVSTQAGVVRQTERHLHDDPPQPSQLDALAAEVRAIFDAGLPADVRRAVGHAVAVAGTATSCAAIDQELDPYDPERVHGHRMGAGVLEAMRDRLAALTTEQRRRVTGLHPDRAPTIVAGVAILLEGLRAFGLEEVEISEHDILRGAALARAQTADGTR